MKEIERIFKDLTFDGGCEHCSQNHRKLAHKLKAIEQYVKDNYISNEAHVQSIKLAELKEKLK